MKRIQRRNASTKGQLKSFWLPLHGDPSFSEAELEAVRPTLRQGNPAACRNVGQPNVFVPSSSYSVPRKSNGRIARAPRVRQTVRFCLTQGVFKVILQKSVPTRIRQLILYVSNSRG